MGTGARTDKERMDFLEARATGYGIGWIARPSTTGRGYRLHETSAAWFGIEPKPTVREAIDDAIERAADGKP